MIPKSNVLKYIFTCVGFFFLAFTITIVLCSVSLKISLLNKLSEDMDEDDDEYSANISSYEDYFEAKYKATIEFVDNVIFIKKKVEEINKEQRIYNLKRYGPMRPTSFIIVIQVHDNLAFLKVLIASLKKVVGITNALLIFCHDYYDNNINDVIRGVSFVKYIQIFYPYSNQLYPKMFPGIDTKFCSGDFNCTELCSNVNECPRTAFLAQQKHFWWWHVNFVFNHLWVMQNYEGPIAFLDQNQYVLQDFLFMLKVLGSLMPENCPQCEIISFGAYKAATSQFHVTNGNVIIEPWHPGLRSIGLAFNKTVWKSIQADSYHFCNFDDYRWSASLMHLASQRPQGPLMMLVSSAPRVLELQLCDGSVAGCTLVDSIEDVVRFAKVVHRGLYPRNLIFNSINPTPKEITAAGEWKDVRDHALCMYFAMN